MKVLLTGASGYIGKRVLPELIKNKYHVVCAVRDPLRFTYPESFSKNISVVKLDLLEEATFKNVPKDIDFAYYLVHSMASSKDYDHLETSSAVNFRNYINQTNCIQVIYLSGISNNTKLSKHLSSRQNVETELAKGNFSVTTLKAGIIIGAGSASFEIIRDIVEKLPIMLVPKWIYTKCQPISIMNVVSYLIGVLGNDKCYNQSFDIGGPDVLTYKQMILDFADERGLKRRIYSVPIMSPRLSTYFLFFVTSTSYKLASALVSSLGVEVVCKESKIEQILPIEKIAYRQAIKNAFARIENGEIISSWKDSFVSGVSDFSIGDFIEVPKYGCFVDQREREIKNLDACKDKIWSIGGKNGWYYANFLWRIRGYIDKFVGGVGLRRGRTNSHTISVGDAVDFWRVLYEDREKGRLLLFAEMKLPGDAWLEFKIKGNKLIQTATFRPKGISGRLYWYLVLPFHGLIFKGLISKLTQE